MSMVSPIDPVLEAEYDNRARVPAHVDIFARWSRDSAAIGEAAVTRDLPYGNHPRQRVDLFPVPNARGTVVFIHGGYWRSLDKSLFAFLVPGFAAQGLAMALVNYRLCPEVGVGAIVDDCRDALELIERDGARHGLAPGKIALAGHSAGGHLVSMFWLQRGTPSRQIVGGLALSGVFDLAPLLSCSMNRDLRLDAAAAAALSPVRSRPVLQVPLHVAAGGDESTAFISQTAMLAAAWPGTCGPPRLVPGRNHFTILDELADPAAASFRSLVGFFD